MAIRKRGIRRFRGKRRVYRGTWFPIQGTSWLGGEEGDFYDNSITDFTDFVAVDRALGPSVVVHPVTQDYTQQPALSAGESTNLRPTLRDFTEGQDYLLKALVGNLYIYVDNGETGSNVFNQNNEWTHVQVAAGFFIARAQDDDQSLPDLTLDEVDPLQAKNIQNSWIWRRNWLLDNPMNARIYGVSGSPESPFTVATFQNWDNHINSDLTGPHFHTKTRRRVKREERLWFALSAIGWDGGRASVNPGGPQPFVKFNLDIRMFGKMMKGKASATF